MADSLIPSFYQKLTGKHILRSVLVNAVVNTLIAVILTG